MRESSNDRHGRWVYQNLRWHYLPETDGSATREPLPDGPAPALSSLVDTRRLFDAVAAWSAVTGLPALVYAVDEGEHLRLLHPSEPGGASMGLLLCAVPSGGQPPSRP